MLSHNHAAQILPATEAHSKWLFIICFVVIQYAEGDYGEWIYLVPKCADFIVKYHLPFNWGHYLCDIPHTSMIFSDINCIRTVLQVIIHSKLDLTTLLYVLLNPHCDWMKLVTRFVPFPSILWGAILYLWFPCIINQNLSPLKRTLHNIKQTTRRIWGDKKYAEGKR